MQPHQVIIVLDCRHSGSAVTDAETAPASEPADPSGTQTTQGPDPTEPVHETTAPPRSHIREATQTAAGVAGGEAARRGIASAVDRSKLIAVARHVATRQTEGASDAEVLKLIASNDCFRKSLACHLHKYLDAEDLKSIYDLRKTLGMSEGRFLKLYATHNYPGLDGFYTGGARTNKATQACFTSHKLSENPQRLKQAAANVDFRVRGKTELVVARGVKKNVAAKTSQGLKGVRETGRSVKDIHSIIEKAAEPAKASQVGPEAATNITAKASGSAALASAGISILCDINKVYKGELRLRQLAENAAWAGSEAGACTFVVASVTQAAAPGIAACATALAGSTLAGTTTMAAGLRTLGPAGLGIGVGIGVSYGVKKLRKCTRG